MNKLNMMTVHITSKNAKMCKKIIDFAIVHVYNGNMNNRLEVDHAFR